MNMFKPTRARTISEYFELLTSDRRETVSELHEFIKKSVPSLVPHFAANMIGYGSFKYRNYKNEIIDWPTIALASQKNYISIYVCAIKDGEYLAEKFRNELGKVSVGKSCIRFKKTSDLNLEALKKALQEAEKNPGLTK